MGNTQVEFPRELLHRSWMERIQYFRSYTMAHPCLVRTRDALLNAIHEVPPNSLILVFGPTGVGKTTLCAKIEQVLISEALPTLADDPGRYPVVSVECVAPESGAFSWRDHFRRLLLQMEEPLVDHKINPAAPVHGGGVVRFTPSEKAVGAEYQHAMERALTFRRPIAVLIDEAQHLAKMGSGRRLADQLDVVKSLANRTKTVHVLFGTYELLALRNLSAQLSRRSVDIHFPRYQLSNSDGAKTFRTILRSFEQQLPLAETPDLVHEWEYLYERSIGCIGILKDWLVKALVSASRSGSSSLTRADLQAHAPTVAHCEKMLSEALEGEARLLESKEQRTQLRARLGLGPAENIGSEPSEPKGSSHPGRLPAPTAPRIRQKPGQRKPIRDSIGPRSIYATATTI